MPHPVDNLARRLRRPRTGRAAYTLMEMIVVCGIILLVAGMSIPILAPFFRGRNVGEAADLFKQSCVLARSRAVQERINFEVIIISQKSQQSVQVRAEDWDDPTKFPTGPPDQDEKLAYKNRMAERNVELPANSKFTYSDGSNINGRLVYAFTPTGTLTGKSSAPLTLSILDLKGEAGKNIYLYTSTGQVTIEEKSF